MGTTNQNVNEEKLHYFFEKYSMPFIQNMEDQGLNMSEICCAVTELFLNVFTSSELALEGIFEPTEEQVENKRKELVDRLMPFFELSISSFVNSTTIN